jgi:hypothetical protein
MNTKNKLSGLTILFAMLTMITIQSCSKYPEGPAVSFRSRDARVANTWKVDNFKDDGTDYTSLVTDYSETFSKDGNYSYSWGSMAGTGKWAFQNDDMEIKVSGISSASSETLFILKLEEKSFWYYYMDGTHRKEFHMIPR